MNMPAMNMNSAPLLSDLLSGYADAPALPLTGIASDSRELQPGYLFLAVAGKAHHGLDFIEQALKADVAAIAWDRSSAALAPESLPVPAIAVDHLAAHLGEIANRFYGRPSHVLNVTGITGTNGKTTVAWLISECLNFLGQRCAYSGTLGFGVKTLDQADSMTTPGAVELHRRLADFVDTGATHAALEVSSHALSQRRVDGVQFDAAIFTNLSRDHLDYHGDMRNYFESKARLFESDVATRQIINIDSDFGAELAARCNESAVLVSTRVDREATNQRHVFVRAANANSSGSDVSIASSWGDGQFSLPLPGFFNVENATLAIAYLLSSGVDLDVACDVLALVSAPKGRLQRVVNQTISVYVDYAHTPDALRSALQALRPHTHGRIWCLFGCGGDRDVGKRPIMASVAEEFADRIVLTTDNPRSERPEAIIADIVAGFGSNDEVVIIEDRAAAVAWAISNAAAGDSILIAGKGHETYQEIAGERLPFSDAHVARAAADVLEDGE